MGLKLKTLGHATLALYDDADPDRPILITDPWLIGSCYWRSWWLQKPPTTAEVAWLARARHVYLTHEHPDHLHPPSLRRLKAEAGDEAALRVITPDFPRMQMDAYLKKSGFAVTRAPPRRWREIAPGVQIMSVPVLINDSILLIDTPHALIIDQNDVKPGRRFIAALGKMTKALDKRVILLRSHSPAGPAQSYFKAGARFQSSTTRDYVLAASRQATAFGASLFVPFASQAVFHRADSAWANDCRVDYRELQRHWASEASLLPPFVTLDLETFAHEAPELPAALPPPSPAARERLDELAAREETERLDETDIQKLEGMLNEERMPILALLPRGLCFDVGPDRFLYDPRRGRLGRLSNALSRQPAARIVAPAATFREAIRYGHIADLFIGMFMEIHLDADTPHQRLNVFYYLMALRDYGYGGLWRLLRWGLWSWRSLRAPVPAPPAPAPPAPAPQSGMREAV